MGTVDGEWQMRTNPQQDFVVAAPAAAITWNVTWESVADAPENTWYSWSSTLNYAGAMTETADGAVAYSEVNGGVATANQQVVQTFPPQPITHRCKWGYLGYGYTILSCKVGI